MKVLFAIALVIAVVAASDDVSDFAKFQDFITKFNRRYTSEIDMSTRFRIFQSNLRRYEMQNKKATSAVFGVSKFSDLTPEEFRSRLGAVPPKKGSHVQAGGACTIKQTTLPKAFDWNTTFGITPVKDQGQCGSCWAFSVTENVESVWIIQGKHTPVDLSPQQIVDCDTQDYGCSGGWPYYAFEYLIQAGGQDSEASYPYKAVNQNCMFTTKGIAAKISSYCYVTQTMNETAMQLFTMNYAPPSVCVDASSWDGYQSGIIQAGDCGTSIDHCVQIVGFGESSGIQYWKVRNSWGADWGEEGFLRIQRNQDVCAIAQVVTSATV